MRFRSFRATCKILLVPGTGTLYADALYFLYIKITGSETMDDLCTLFLKMCFNVIKHLSRCWCAGTGIVNYKKVSLIVVFSVYVKLVVEFYGY